jgi:translation initiation factor IF-2
MASKVEGLINADTERNEVRAPVVVVMGHVDHGKTSLLDSIRTAHVADKEHGGITQHIGAYQVVDKGRPITFIDTPGHEAFTAMRSRGANVADIAIVVIAADDGIKPQTREVLSIVERTKLPFVVAITKIDKDGAGVDKVKTDLASINLQPEDWGGKVITVGVSGKTGEGIPQLLDTLLLVADMEKEKLMTNSKGNLVGTIIESHVDTGEGPVATVIIQNGTLRRGDFIVAGPVVGKVRSLKSWNGKIVDSAGPSVPVVILGLKAAPSVGDVVEAPEDERAARKLMKQQEATLRLMQVKARESAQTASVIAGTTKKIIKKLPLFLKADKVGSLEAIVDSMKTFVYPDVQPEIVGQGLGDITEADVMRAEQADAWLMGFNVSANQKAVANARTPVKTFTIIYNLLDEIKAGLEARLGVEIIEDPIGQARVLKIFRQDGKTAIAGAKVTEGVVKAKAKAKVRVFRSGKLLGNATLEQLQQNKQNVGEVATNQECGLKLMGVADVTEGDTLLFIEEKRVARKLE